MIATTSSLSRTGTSVALSAAVGYERERTGRAAGPHTRVLVGLASATFLVV